MERCACTLDILDVSNLAYLLAYLNILALICLLDKIDVESYATEEGFERWWCC